MLPLSGLPFQDIFHLKGLSIHGHLISTPVLLSVYLTSLNKYAYHILDLDHTAIMLNGHVGTPILHQPYKKGTLYMYLIYTSKQIRLPH